MDTFKQECKLCDEIISDKSFEVIDDNTNYIFGVLLLKLTFGNETGNVMCKMCSSRLLAAFTFKLTCLNTENTITPYVHFDNSCEVDLKDIYVRENQSNQGSRVLDDWEICRLCLQPVSSEHKSIQEVANSSIQVYIPEINFAVTSNPTICINCHDGLCVHSTFIRNCLDVEEKRNINEIKVQDILLTNPLIKTEEIEIKSEYVHEEDKLFEILHTVETGERNATIHFSEVQMLHCDQCDYKCIQKSNLRWHQLIHHNPLEVQIYECGECDYRTKHKDYLAKHVLRHKDASEVQMYFCDECDFKSIHKTGLGEHQLTHKVHSEVQMYTCDKCDYKCTQKGNLKRHQLRHKDTAEVQMYRCDKCKFTTKYKFGLKSHQRIHKDPSEVPMYRCGECNYESSLKRCLKSHQLRHKDPSEMQMYECNKCKFTTKHKKSLKRHQSTHTDSLEVHI